MSSNRIEGKLVAARTAARKSTMGIKMGAVLVRGNRVIKSGFNCVGKYPRYIGGWSRHAEAMATLNVNAQGATVYVFREHAKDKTPLLAKPCFRCVEWLSWLGVKNVIYSQPEWPYWEEMELN